MNDRLNPSGDSSITFLTWWFLVAIPAHRAGGRDGVKSSRKTDYDGKESKRGEKERGREREGENVGFGQRA